MHIPIQNFDFTEQCHLTAQVLASVVSRLFQNVELMGGGLYSLGFYYDFVFEQPLTEGMIEFIEVEMHRTLKEEHSLRFLSMMRENAQNLFNYHAHSFLADRAAEQSSTIIELVQIDDFYGLCPNLSFTSIAELGAIKILEWFSFTHDEDGEELNVTRLRGTVQPSSRDLKKFWKNYLLFLKKRDHRTLGPKLNLFSFSESTGELGVTWHPKGVQLQNTLLEKIKGLVSEEAQFLSTPSVVRSDFLGRDRQALDSFLFENQEYRLRCSPLLQHLEFLKHRALDNEELPWRMTEWTNLFRYCSEPQRWGLFSQCAYFGEYTTICCLEEQVVEELISSLHFIEQIITIFDFKAQWVLIASPQKSSKANHEQAGIKWLKQAIAVLPRHYPLALHQQVEEEGEGAALELRVQDVLGREWPVARVNVIRPLQKGMRVGEENSARVILTRQLLESLDRLIALLIENYEGMLPLWLAPEQVRVLAIGKANQDYAKQVTRRLKDKGLRVKLDLRSATLGLRIHEAEKENVPYLVLVGEQERMRETISVRTFEKLNQSRSEDLETFLNKVHQESLSPSER